MPEMTAYRHGVPNWIDVSADDVDAVARFYCDLFGWTLGPDLGPDAGGYRMFQKDGLDVAGIGPRMDPNAPPSWTTYVNVSDVDDAAAAAQAAGGAVVVGPMDLPNDSGRMAFVVDPTGGFTGLYQAGTHIGARRVNEEGTLVWNELTTREADAALGFYSKVLGWTTEPMEGAMTYHLCKVDGRTVAGCMTMDESWPEGLPTHWMTYFAVDDVDAAAARCTELGGAVMVEPQDMSVGRFAVLNDPGGAWFSVITFSGGIDDPNAWPDD